MRAGRAVEALGKGKCERGVTVVLLVIVVVMRDVDDGNGEQMVH